MSYSDFKEVVINNPGTASFYGADDLLEIMKIFNAKVVSNRQVKIKNPWVWQDSYDVQQIAVNPSNPGANTKRFYVDASDGHFKMKSSTGAVVDIDVLGQGEVGEANTASNIGTAGVGIWKDKVSLDLRFKKLNAGSNKVTITDDTGNNEVDVDVTEANLLLQNLGGVATVPKGGTGLSTLTANALLKGNGTGNVSLITTGTDGHILTMVSGSPAWAAAGASSDVKTAVFEGGSQIGSVGRRLNFSNSDDFTITENAGSDRFDISLNRREQLVAAWQLPGSVAYTNVGTTYTNIFSSNGDGCGFDVDGTGMNNFRFYVSWNKNGGVGTHGCRVIDNDSSNVLAEISNCQSGRNVTTGTLPAYFQDAIRTVKVQMKSTISLDDPMFRIGSLYFK